MRDNIHHLCHEPHPKPPAHHPHAIMRITSEVPEMRIIPPHLL
ncbi:hypothetical protein [Bartonella raoultii]|nr:hypothetical protein [Bartonella raoultii]